MKMRYTAAVATKIAIPPSTAVGRLCQRSVLGVATKPRLRANERTATVESADSNAANRAMTNGFVKISGIEKFSVESGDILLQAIDRIFLFNELSSGFA